MIFLKTKKIISVFLICAIFFLNFAVPVFASEIDFSIDENIRKNYNPDKIEQDLLPSLPPSLIQDENTNSYSANVYDQKYSTATGTTRFATIKKGQKFKVKLATNLNDRSPKGGGITFINLYPVTSTYITVPSGSKFKGVVLDSHPAQFTGNGGLLVIKVNSLTLNGAVHPLNAYITKANTKKIFFNNIKGKRNYLKSTWNSTNPGYKFMKKMWGYTKDFVFAGNLATWILSPFSLASGVIVYGFNVVMSPVFGMFAKGGNLVINSGSLWEIKLIDDLIIYY